MLLHSNNILQMYSGSTLKYQVLLQILLPTFVYLMEYEYFCCTQFLPVGPKMEHLTLSNENNNCAGMQSSIYVEYQGGVLQLLFPLIQHSTRLLL